MPYATAVQVESFKERENGVVAISAAIILERDTQKGIIIGKKGEMLEKIGSQARQDIERLLDTRVFLELFVKVEEIGAREHQNCGNWDTNETDCSYSRTSECW